MTSREKLPNKRRPFEIIPNIYDSLEGQKEYAIILETNRYKKTEKLKAEHEEALVSLAITESANLSLKKTLDSLELQNEKLKAQGKRDKETIASLQARISTIAEMLGTLTRDK